ncbi:MAG TPA: YfhO family protein [Longimicrobium sp.]|nr:YfhO family protein [Longimicrobium sp.]
MSKKTAPAPAAAPQRRASLLAQPAEREPGIGAGTAAAIYFALALLYFIPAFMPGKQIFGTDFTQAGYFFQDLLSKSFAAGHLPKWVPYLFGGLPIYSNAGSTYYPVRFVADWILPVKDILPAIFLAQFFIAGWGMYLLARELGCRAWVAFVAGLCFQWTGLLTSWVYAGHDGRVIVASFIPIFFFFLHRGIRTASLAPFAGAAGAVGFALLSFQIQVCWYMLVAGLIWAVFCLVHLGVFRRGGAVSARVIVMGLASVAFGFAMAGVNFLPFLSYVEASPRAGPEGRGYEYSVSYSMPKAYVAGMVAPEAIGGNVANPNDGQPALPQYVGENGMKLHTEYLGATVLILFGLGCWYARRSRYFWFFGGMGLFFLTLAFGGNTPLYRLYWEILPGLKQFRAPDLAYCIVAFSMITMAALGLEALARARAAEGDRKAAAGEHEDVGLVPWIGAGAALVAILLAGILMSGSQGVGAGIGRFGIFAAGVVVAVWLWSSRRMPSMAALAVLALITVADLWVIGKKYFYTIPGPEVIYAADDVTAFLQTQPKPFRAWPLPRQSAWPTAIDYPMLYGIEQVGGEHGNQLQRYNEYVGPSPMASQPSYENVGTDPRFRAAGDIRYIVVSALLDDPALREVFRGQQAVVYENTQSLGRAWIVGQAIRADAGSTMQTLKSPRWDPRVNAVVESPRDLALGGPQVRGTARITRHEADRVDVTTEANGAALLVLADNYYKDWRATVDGRPAEIYRTNHTFRGVVVPAGRHQVAFTFEPAGLYTGFYLFLGTMGLLAAYGLWLLIASLRRKRDEVVVDAPPEPAPA